MKHITKKEMIEFSIVSQRVAKRKIEATSPVQNKNIERQLNDHLRAMEETSSKMKMNNEKATLWKLHKEMKNHLRTVEYLIENQESITKAFS